MGQSEYELIRYENIRHMQIFVVAISFRNAHIHRAWELGLVLEGSAQIRLKDRCLTAICCCSIPISPMRSPAPPLSR